MIESEEKKEYLKLYIPKLKAAKRLEEEIERIRLDKMSPSLIYDGMPHGTDKKDLSDYMAKLDNLERQLIKARYERIDLYTKIFRNIEQLEDEREKELLTYRYLRGYSWDKVCIEMGYSWRQIHNIHEKALEHFKIEKSA